MLINESFLYINNCDVLAGNPQRSAYFPFSFLLGSAEHEIFFFNLSFQEMSVITILFHKF